MRIAFAIVCMVSLASCESISSHYASVAEAREKGAFAKGWLPEILPESATEIAVASVPDSSTCEGKLALDEHSVVPFLVKLSPAGDFRYTEQREWVQRLKEAGSQVGYHSSGRVLFAFSCAKQKCVFVCGPGT